jgi:hypothetical protein
VLDRLGFHLGGPADFHPATEHDPEGYREHIAVWELNEEVLAASGASWDQPQRFDPAKLDDAVRSRFVDRASETLQSLRHGAGTRPVAIKDPRLSLTLPLWRAALPASTDVRYVVMTRDPLEVARSLAARDGIPLEAGLALWEAYQRGALNGTDLASTALVSQSSLLVDPSGTVRQLLASFGEQASSGDLGAVVRPDLRRQIVETDDSRQWLWPALQDLVETTARGGIRRPAPPVSASLSPLAHGLLERYGAVRRDRSTHSATIVEISSWNEKLTADNAAASAEAATARTLAAAALAEAEALRRRDVEVSSWNDSLTLQLDGARRELATQQDDLASQAAQIEELQRTIAALAAEVSATQQALGHARAELATRHQELETFTHALSEARLALQNASGGLSQSGHALTAARHAAAAWLASRRLRWSDASVRWLLGPAVELERLQHALSVDVALGLQRVELEQRGNAAAIEAADGILRTRPSSGSG